MIISFIDNNNDVWAYISENKNTIYAGYNCCDCKILDLLETEIETDVHINFISFSDKGPFLVAMDENGYIWQTDQIDNPDTLIKVKNEKHKEIQFIDFSCANDNIIALDTNGNLWMTGFDYFHDGRCCDGEEHCSHCKYDGYNVLTQITRNIKISVFYGSYPDLLAIDNDDHLWIYGSLSLPNDCEYNYDNLFHKIRLKKSVSFLYISNHRNENIVAIDSDKKAWFYVEKFCKHKLIKRKLQLIKQFKNSNLRFNFASCDYWNIFLADDASNFWFLDISKTLDTNSKTYHFVKSSGLENVALQTDTICVDFSYPYKIAAIDYSGDIWFCYKYKNFEFVKLRADNAKFISVVLNESGLLLALDQNQTLWGMCSTNFGHPGLYLDTCLNCENFEYWHSHPNEYKLYKISDSKFLNITGKITSSFHKKIKSTK